MSELEGTVEHRASARRRCRLSSCRLLSREAGGPTQPAEVRDISPDGIGLVCGAPLRPGTLLVLELTGPNMRLAFALEVRVVHTGRLADGRWLAGCVFAGKLLASLVALLR